jgi:hypothetical protein
MLRRISYLPIHFLHKNDSNHLITKTKTFLRLGSGSEVLSEEMDDSQWI